MQSKRSKQNKSRSTTQAGVISKAVENLRNKPTTHHKQQVTNGVDRHEMIAMAAYYRSQKRNLNNGDETQDWLEAEAEVDGLI